MGMTFINCKMTFEMTGGHLAGIDLGERVLGELVLN
jgi:hypothetical protein